MDKHILFVMTPFLSHVIPTYKLAKHFQKRGYKVVYVSSIKLQGEITANGFMFQNSAVLGKDKKSFLKVDELISYILTSYRPEICFVELSFWKWALFLLGSKQRFMMIQTWPCCNKGPFLTPQGYRLVKKRNPVTYFLNELSWIRQNRIASQKFKETEFKDHYWEIVKKAKLNPLQTYISMHNRISHYKILNVHELILFPKEFDLPSQADPWSKFIGPFVDTRRMETEFDWAEIRDGGRPIIFCSLGSLSSIFKHRNLFYRRLISGFLSRPDLILIMSIGHNNNVLSDASLPENVHVTEYAPQLDILRKASLFITHGGAGSVRESIQFGVPMLVYPWQTRSDMFGLADRIEYHGLGTTGNMEEDSSNDIMCRIDSVLSNNTIHEQTARMQRTFIAYEKFEDQTVDRILLGQL